MSMAQIKGEAMDIEAKQEDSLQVGKAHRLGGQIPLGVDLQQDVLGLEALLDRFLEDLPGVLGQQFREPDHDLISLLAANAFHELGYGGSRDGFGRDKCL